MSGMVRISQDEVRAGTFPDTPPIPLQQPWSQSTWQWCCRHNMCPATKMINAMTMSSPGCVPNTGCFFLYTCMPPHPSRNRSTQQQCCRPDMHPTNHKSSHLAALLFNYFYIWVHPRYIPTPNTKMISVVIPNLSATCTQTIRVAWRPFLRT